MSRIDKGDSGSRFPVNVIYVLYFFLMLGNVLVCVFLSKINYSRKIDANISNVWLLAMGICLLLLFHKLMTKIEMLFKKAKYIILLILALSVAFLIGQIYIIYNYYFFTDWDVPMIVECARESIGVEFSDTVLKYFSQYPNNLFLVFIYAKIIQFVSLLGYAEHSYFAILILQCLITWVIGLQIFDVVRQLAQKDSMAFFAYDLYLFMVGLSPWISIPYSDSVGLFFPMTIVWLYIRKPEKQKYAILKWFFIALISYMGYKVKPQILIITIAIVVVHCFIVLRKRRKFEKGIIKKSIAFLAGFFCSVMLVSLATGSLGMELNEEKAFGLPHFFMMGMNEEAMGVWDEGDVNFSASFNTVDKRNKEDLKEAERRIKEMGAVGVIKHFCRKTLTNYNDGTFAWGYEGTFYMSVLPEKNNTISPLLRNIYYNRSCIGKYYPVWCNVMQMVWISMLLLSVFSAFIPKKREVAVLMLAIIGLTIFELLFEARARYLFTYVPIYIILGTIGIGKVSQWLSIFLISLKKEYK